MKIQPFYICIMGPHGSGKGTQAKMLAGDLNLPHISTGNLYRRHVQRRTKLGQRVKVYLDEGQYVPDNITNVLMKKTIMNAKYKDGLILDGYPRTLNQADYLHGLVKHLVVVYINLSAHESFKRLLKRARVDDTEAIIKERFKNYQILTEPVLEYYRNQGQLITINGDQLINQVRADLKLALRSYV